MELFNLESQPTDLQVCYCGYEDCADDFYCGPNTRDCWLIHLVMKGQGYYLLNGVEYLLKTGDIFVIFPGDVVHYRTAEGDPWSFYWFAFKGPMAETYLSHMSLSRENPVAAVASVKELGDSIQHLLDSVQGYPSGNQLLITGSLYHVVGILQKQLQSNGHEKKNKEVKQYIDRAILYIEYNYFRNISSKDVAAYVNLERTYFCKLFKVDVGITPQQYIIKYRIQMATGMLRNSGFSASHIAKGVGFDNINHFFRTFKKYTSLTPEEYRNRKVSGMPGSGDII